MCMCAHEHAKLFDFVICILYRAGRLADDAQGTNGTPIKIGYNKVSYSNHLNEISILDIDFNKEPSTHKANI